MRRASEPFQNLCCTIMAFQCERVLMLQCYFIFLLTIIGVFYTNISVLKLYKIFTIAENR